MDEEYPPKCPRCGKRDVDIETSQEYTGGGYVESRDLFFCRNCGNEFESESRIDYA